MITATDARVVPLRPLGVAELLDAAVRVVRRTVRVSLAVTLPVVLVGTVVVSLLTYAAVDDTGLALTQLLVQLFVGSLVTVVLGGVLAPAYTAQVLDRPGTSRGVLRGLGRSAPALAGLALVVAFGLEVGVVALVVGGVWLWGVWALAAPALTVERLGPLAALRRSAELVRGGFWRVWGTRALCWVATTVLGVVVTIPFTLLAAAVSDSDPLRADGIGSAGVYVTITSLGSLLARLLLTPVEVAVDTMLYLDARMRREGLDLVVALDADASERTVGRPLPTTPSPW